MRQVPAGQVLSGWVRGGVVRRVPAGQVLSGWVRGCVVRRVPAGQVSSGWVRGGVVRQGYGRWVQVFDRTHKHGVWQAPYCHLYVKRA